MMKKFILLCAAATLLAGCRSSYDVTLANGMGGGTKYTGVTKPRYNKATGKYTFKTADGREYSVYPTNVKLIEPHQEVYAPNFNAKKK